MANRTTRRTFLGTSTAGVAALWATPFAAGAPSKKEVSDLVAKAITALKAKQNADGSFVPRLGGPGVTAIVAAGLIRVGVPADEPVVAKSLQFLEKSIQPDGGIYSQRLANYTTCVALMAFKEANTRGQYDKIIADAAKFLKTVQKGDDVSESDSRYGGVGYDGRTRPDLSNTHYFVDALIDAGVSQDDPALKRALAFVSRCQNLKSESNQLAFAGKASEDDKGGFVYTPTEADAADTGKGKASRNVTPEGGLRSYGSMTYAGLKSLLHAGVSKDDVRVKAALGWIKRHYSVTENPGQKDAGLFYYYHLFAKTLDTVGDDSFIDAKDVKHDWKQELFDELKKRQKPDGSWANSNNAFFEGTPELATAFAILALSYVREKAK